MGRRFPAIPRHVQHFVVSIGCLLLFPLIPLLFEGLFTGGISDSSLHLVTATYAITVGVSSRDMLLFVSGMVIGFMFAVFYGYSVSVSEGIYAANVAAIAVIALVFLFHLAERYNRHVAERTPFLEFVSPSSNGGGREGRE